MLTFKSVFCLLKTKCYRIQIHKYKLLSPEQSRIQCVFLNTLMIRKHSSWPHTRYFGKCMRLTKLFSFSPAFLGHILVRQWKNHKQVRIERGQVPDRWSWDPLGSKLKGRGRLGSRSQESWVLMSHTSLMSVASGKSPCLSRPRLSDVRNQGFRLILSQVPSCSSVLWSQLPLLPPMVFLWLLLSYFYVFVDMRIKIRFGLGKECELLLKISLWGRVG